MHRWGKMQYKKNFRFHIIVVYMFSFSGVLSAYLLKRLSYLINTFEVFSVIINFEKIKL